jgi:protein-S-isoprenylcysteine O-methyltransferase Ste14
MLEGVLQANDMELIPEIRLGLLNGWLPLALFYIIFGILLFTFPKSVVARLYDRSGWTKTQRNLTAFGKLFIFTWLFLVIFTPLEFGRGAFVLGISLYLIGLVGIVNALLNYKDTPLDQPVTIGLYSISRNPQQVTILMIFLGISLMIGSWLAVILLGIGAVFAHIRVHAEERSCLEQYGASYENYMEEVPRYFVFF